MVGLTQKNEAGGLLYTFAYCNWWYYYTFSYRNKVLLW